MTTEVPRHRNLLLTPLFSDSLSKPSLLSSLMSMGRYVKPETEEVAHITTQRFYQDRMMKCSPLEYHCLKCTIFLACLDFFPRKIERQILPRRIEIQLQWMPAGSPCNKTRYGDDRRRKHSDKLTILGFAIWSQECGQRIRDFIKAEKE
jgi:hypothetical protein